ncbi:MAG: hypothetical protein ACYS17_12140 [Planctomycetota bacterium]
MKHRVLSYKILSSLTLGIFLLLPPEKTCGFRAGSNSWHLNSPFQAKSNSDVVCKIKVLSIRQEEVIKSNLSPGAPDVCRMIARSKVISVIKGKCPQAIDIEFHYPKDRNPIAGLPIGHIYTELSKNEVCIVFLKHEKSVYKLNRINSKIRVQPKVIDYILNDTPNLKLLAEFLAGCNSDNEFVKLQAVEELGYLGNTMIHQIYRSPYLDSKQVLQRCIEIDSALKKARVTIKKVYSSRDVVIKNLAVIASFQVGVSPGIEKPLALLRMNPSDFDLNDSLKKYGSPDFCISSLQLRLLQTMDSTTRRFLVNLKDQSIMKKASGSYLRGVPDFDYEDSDFDYEDFAKQASQCKVVKDSKEMRSAIAHILWITDDRFIR